MFVPCISFSFASIFSKQYLFEIQNFVPLQKSGGPTKEVLKIEELNSKKTK